MVVDVLVMEVELDSKKEELYVDELNDTSEGG